MAWSRIFPWAYERKSLPGPGSENIAFLTLALPYQTPIGPAQANVAQFGFQRRENYVPKMRGIDGIGGPLTGQIYGVPLIDRNK